jgi:hypothetical protein
MQSASNLGDIGTETVSRSFLEKAGDFGLGALAKGSNYLSAAELVKQDLSMQHQGATPVVLQFANGELIVPYRSTVSYDAQAREIMN